MISLLLLMSIQPALCSTPVPSNSLFVVDDPQEEYKQRREEAGKDEGKLWKLYEWCEAYGLGKEGRSCLRAILKVNKDHTGAHEGLGHILYEGEWFTNQKKLDEHIKKEELRRAKEEGLVKHEGEWVSKDDLPYLKKGLVRNASGEWIDAEELRRIEEGWQKQDLIWISPEEQAKVTAGLWKCGEEWLSLEDANKYHSEVDQWWAIPTDYFVVYSTCSRDVVLKAVEHIDYAFRELSRIYGSSPKDLVPVVVLNSQAQYSSLAAGGGNRQPIETHGLSSIHYAFFADLLFIQEGKEVIWTRTGVGYWDTNAENGDLWGKHSVRHAAGQSFAEAMDPSPKTVKEFESSGSISDQRLDKFYAEKIIPEWFRVGAVTYGERYFVDSLVAAGGNPNWARDWSIQNILKQGGLQSIKEIINGELSSSDPESSAKRMNQLGLVMAFIVDGKIPELKQAHAAVKAAIKSGSDAKSEFKALVKALTDREDEFRKFAGV